MTRTDLSVYPAQAGPECLYHAVNTPEEKKQGAEAAEIRAQEVANHIKNRKMSECETNRFPKTADKAEINKTSAE